jgi:MFS family permease
MKAGIDIESPAGVERGASELRLSLRRVVVAWLFGAVWMFITTGAAMTQFGKLVGMSPFGFGVLAALPFFGALAQLPTSLVIERWGNRRSVFLVTCVVHRMLWLAVAAVPWVLPDAHVASAVLLVIGVSAVFGHMATPAWVSWMADLVPTRLRGRYFSRRIQLGQLVGLCATVIVGLLLDRAEVAGLEVLLRTVSILFAAASVCGTIDILIFLKVPDEKREAKPALQFWALIRGPLGDRSFRRYLAFTATLTFGIGFIPPFVWLYLLDEVKLTNFQASMMLQVVPLMVTMGMLPLWGRLTDRLGRKPVLVIAGLMIVHGAAVWIFVTREHWWLGYMASLIATAAWPGMELANFNFLLGMSGSEGGRRQGSAYVALNSLVAALAGMVSGLAAGVLAEALKNWRGSIAGWPLTYHGVLFLLSAALRLLALAWLIGLDDTKAVSTRMALRYIGSNIYSNVQQAIFTPVRLLGSLGKWTYRVGRRDNPPSDKRG